MATETQKILGQVNPSATTLTTAYTVPAATAAVVSSIVVCNAASGGTTFRVSVAQAGASDAPKQYLYFDVPIDGNDTFIATIGATMAATDVVRVYAGDTSLAFSIFGVEIS